MVCAFSYIKLMYAHGLGSSVGALHVLLNVDDMLLTYCFSSDLAIAGFNDLPAAAWMHPALSTVRTTRGRVGELAANMLLALMRGEMPEQHCIDVGFELVMRDRA